MPFSSDIAKPRLAQSGVDRIDWAEAQMDVLREIRSDFSKEKPLLGVRIAACLHVTTESAVLMRTLHAGGADVVLCASNPLSTQDDTAAALVKRDRIPVFARNGEDRATYYRHLNAAVSHRPQITMDDGADLVSLLHAKRKAHAKHIWGSTEETTTGVIRLKSMEKRKVLKFPVIAVNDSKTKHLFDNRYGTGQSTIDGILRATNLLLAGKVFVVAGYGMCGRGVATRARGMGAKVVVTEVDPIRALEAHLDGYTVLPMADAARVGEVFVTTTGNTSILRKEHFLVMPDRAVVANAGHFDVEIDLPALQKLAKSVRQIRPLVTEYTLRSGKRINVLADGRLVNLAAAEGHPASVMDMSFANQALAAAFIAKNHAKLERRVYTLPADLDERIARLKLATLGVRADTLTPKQRKYLTSWEFGT